MHKGCYRLPRATCHGLTCGAYRTAMMLMLASWLGGCDAAWQSKAFLKVAVQAYNVDPAAATATYGLIADWDVSAITDMSGLFSGMQNFNADISSWNTSSVTTMDSMFRVCSARALSPAAFSRCVWSAPPQLSVSPSRMPCGPQSSVRHPACPSPISLYPESADEPSPALALHLHHR